MRIGVIGSSGGSVFADLYRILRGAGLHKDSFVVVTDRECGLGDFCVRNGLEHIRVDERNNASFSAKAAEHLGKPREISYVLLYYARLVTHELFAIHPTLNLHPALLPAFPGFNAVQQAHRYAARFLGATLHAVDASIDGGPLVAQTVMPIRLGTPLSLMQKYSFVQKLYLSVLSYELVRTGRLHLSPTAQGCVPELDPLPYTSRCNPSIQDADLLAAVQAVQNREQVEVIE